MPDRLDTMTDAFTDQIDELETVYFDLRDKRLDIDAAEGVQLDNFGKIIGRERHGESDFDYRNSLKAQIIINSGETTAEEIIAAVDASLGGISTLTLVDFYPAHFDFFINDTITNTLGLNANRIVQDLKGAAIRGIVYWHTDSDYFGFAADPAAKGFGVGKFGTARDF